MGLHIHVTPPWNAIGSESQKKEEKKEKEKKKKKLVTVRLCANFCPLSRDFWIFLWCVFFLQTGVSLRKPENLIFHSKGTLECFHTHM